MKRHYLHFLTMALLWCTVQQGFSQTIQQDTLIASGLTHKGDSLMDIESFKAAAQVFEKAASLYERHQIWRNYLQAQNRRCESLWRQFITWQALPLAKKIVEESQKYLGEGHPEEGRAWNHIGVVRMLAGQRDASEESFLKALDIYENAYGGIHERVATINSNLSVLYEQHAEYDKALEFAQKALEAGKKYHKNDLHPALMRTYRSIGDIYSKQGNFDAAITAHQKSIQILEKQYAEANPKIAWGYDRLALIYREKGDFDTALKYYQTALDIYGKLYPEDHPQLQATYNGIANLYFVKAMYAKAQIYYQKSITILEKKSNANPREIARAYDNLASCLIELGQYDTAKGYQDKAEQLFIQSKDPAGLFKLYNNKLSFAFDRGYYLEAQDLAVSTIAQAKKIFKEEALEVATLYFNLGIIYEALGKYEAGLESLNKAVPIFEKIKGRDNYQLSNAYNSLGEILLMLERPNEAKNYFQKSLNLVINTHGKNSIPAVKSQIGIAEYYKITQQKAQTLPILEDVLGKLPGLFPKEHRMNAKLLDKIGSIYAWFGELETAADLKSSATAILRKLFGKDSPQLLLPYMGLSRIYAQQSAFKKAEKTIAQAFKIYDTHPDNLTRERGFLFENLGSIRAGQKKYRDAIGAYQQGLLMFTHNNPDTHSPYILPPLDQAQLIHPAVRNLLQGKAKALFALYREGNSQDTSLLHHTLSCLEKVNEANQLTQKQSNQDADRINTAKASSEMILLALMTCNELYQHSGNQAYVAKSFQWAERLKAKVLRLAILESKAKKIAGIPDSLLRQEKELTTRINFLKQKIQEELTDRDLKHFQVKLTNAQRDYQALIQRFEKTYPRYYDLKFQEQELDLRQLQENLPENVALLSFTPLKNYTFIHILTKDSLSFYTRETPDLVRWVNAMRSGLVFQSKNTYARGAHTLYQLLFPGALPEKIDKLVLIPGGKLSLIPFEALLSKEAGNASYQDLAYLIRKYEISYAYSTQLYADRLQDMVRKDQQSKSLLAIAPVFSRGDVAGVNLKTKSFLENLVRNDQERENSRGNVLTLSQINELPGSEKEVEVIFDIFKKQELPAQVLTHQNASETTFVNASLKDFSYIHIASHGFVNEEKPELSGIIFAQSSSQKDTPQENDGILFLGEMYGLDLQADLVTLSACETGLGKIAEGEGMIGLSRALIYAGAKNALVSLWKVADASTSSLMINFYESFLSEKNNVSFKDNLRETKLTMIRDAKTAKPYYWSPFILIGD